MDERLRISRPAAAGFILSAAAAAAVAGAGFGTRLQWWDFRTGLAVLRYGALLAAAGGAVSAAGIFASAPGGRRRGLLLAVAGFLLGSVSFAVPAGEYRLARTLPAIHDITTDTGEPPAFVAILPLRAGAPNPAAYGGEEVARMQRSAYPDIRTLSLDAEPGEAFRLALREARAAGWRIVASDAAAGRIEAVAETRWFGFRDDVVVRVLPGTRGGSRIDVRSVSRVGKSDVGANARRIRAFLDRLSPPLA